jgi:hypothetical protein
MARFWVNFLSLLLSFLLKENKQKRTASLKAFLLSRFLGAGFSQKIKKVGRLL